VDDADLAAVQRRGVATKVIQFVQRQLQSRIVGTALDKGKPFSVRCPCACYRRCRASTSCSRG